MVAFQLGGRTIQNNRSRQLKLSSEFALPAVVAENSSGIQIVQLPAKNRSSFKTRGGKSFLPAANDGPPPVLPNTTLVWLHAIRELSESPIAAWCWLIPLRRAVGPPAKRLQTAISHSATNPLSIRSHRGLRAHRSRAMSSAPSGQKNDSNSICRTLTAAAPLSALGPANRTGDRTVFQTFGRLVTIRGTNGQVMTCFFRAKRFDRQGNRLQADRLQHGHFRIRAPHRDKSMLLGGFGKREQRHRRWLCHFDAMLVEISTGRDVGCDKRSSHTSPSLARFARCGSVAASFSAQRCVR